MLSLRKGFTLIEILIVIAIIGILASSISYFTRDSRIAQTNAERLANNIGDTIKNARNNMIIGRGVYSGSQLVSTDKRTISIKGGEISTTFAYNNATNTGTETSLRYPFYDNDGQYQITDISVSSGIIVNNYSMTWDHTGVTDANITVLPNGDLSIIAMKGGTGIAIPINTIRITAGYQGFERSVVLDRVTGRSEVLKGREGSDNPLLPPVNGTCDNTSQYACTVGTPSSMVPNYVGSSCGGTSTWNCTGAGGGSTQSCSRINPSCPINGSCNNSTQFSCTTGISSANNPGVCGGSSTWSCLGQFGGTTDITCSIPNSPCPINGSCGGSNNTCGAGSPSGFSAGSCGGSSSWSCLGQFGGSNTSCGIANAPCPINGSCNNSTQFSCSAGTSSANNPGVCGGSSTWSCLGQFGGTNATSCNIANSPCPINGSCGGSNNTCGAGSPSGFSAGSCGGSSSWSCLGQFGGSNASCGIANAPCPINGSCNNAIQFSCSAGTSSANNPGSCGGSSTWSCLGQFGGTNATSCSRANAACVVNGSCGGSNNTCGAGSPSGYSAGSCGGSSSWTCNGSGGGSNASCGIANGPCAVNGSCGGSNNTCSSGSPSGFSAGSCGGSSSWTCNGQFGGSNAACGIANAACAVPVNCSYSTYQGGTCSSASCGNYGMYYTITSPATGGGTCAVTEGQFANWGGASCNTGSIPSSNQSIACSSAAGSYGIPANYTVGTAYYRVETASCNANYGQVIWTNIGGCSAPAPVNCSYNTYQGGSCNVSCGGGNYDTYYNITVPASGGGTCPVSQGQFAGWSGGSCNTGACATNGPYSYGGWGACSGPCGPGNGTQSRSESCGYTTCHTPQSTSQSCTASACAAPINGVCGSAFNCTAGTPSGQSCMPKESYPRGCYLDWSCDGLNGGSTASCFNAVGCFTADQLVRTPKGEIEISILKVGDIVISYDEITKQFVENAIDRVIIHDGKNNPLNNFDLYPLIQLSTRVNGIIKTTKVTDNHLYFSPDEKIYKEIKEFQYGERIQSIDGIGYVIGKIKLSSTPVVYNLHMAKAPNNYLVNGVVVHNEKAESCTDFGGFSCN